MRHAMWKVHCVAVLLLTGINLYLLVKLTNCSDRIGAHWNSNQSVEELVDNQLDPWTRHRVSETAVKRSWKFVRIKESFIGPEADSAEAESAVWTRHERYDASRRFAIREFALVGANFRATAVNQNVCLSTQSSLDRLISLPEAVDHWRGAVSVAVYVDGDEVRVFERVVRHLRRCHADLVSNIAFHVVSAARQPLPSGTSPLSGWTSADASVENGNNATINCTDPSEALAWLLRERPPLSAKWESGRAYPQNLMRNVARKGCPGQYVMLLDVDVIPSYDMADQVTRFLSSAPDCPKCAYVVPTYELDYSADFPTNKSQLLAYESQGRAQPFHHKAFRYNQYASNLTRWAQTPETDRTVVSHNVTNYEFFYEPFYIARDDAPPHDERFLGYGFTRNTQVYEMALAGWTFHVLSPIFTVHWGMQMKQRRPTWRKNQMDRNRRVFDAIHNELKVRYGLVNKGPVRWHAKPSGGNGKPVKSIKT